VGGPSASEEVVVALGGGCVALGSDVAGGNGLAVEVGSRVAALTGLAAEVGGEATLLSDSARERLPITSNTDSRP
jgi:hypothetical protein